ncbi:hypothetical protein [Luteipulveratus mongoliensis]|uniref:Uncharacterized protein n=1 Tax=Luteipulveratus mongoliensis TaxID=571913 RepID=A0A0K1JMA0_9MICO|nr:hypothetical protein [Luteipulveratus mongoliensis]AKU17847.1 hypothetical protein VV02_21600 [Luteipulveratus mongoliensis]
MIRRAYASLAAVGIGGALLATGIPSASAGVIGTCKMHMTDQVRVVQPTQNIYTTFDGGCVIVANSFATWHLRTSSQAIVNHMYYGDDPTSSWSITDSVRLGEFTWSAGGAQSGDGNSTFTQNEFPIAVRVGSWAGIYPSRSGSTVTLTAQAVRYATSLNRNIAWEGATGWIQYRNSDGTWANLRSVTLNSAGQASWSYTRSTSRTYRVVIDGQPTIWAATSPSAVK